MKNIKYLTLYLSTVITSTMLSAVEIVDGWELSGNIRTGFVKYSKAGSEGGYLSPEISISSPKDNRLGVKISVAGVTDFGVNDENKDSGNYVFANNKSFSMLNEILLSYKDKQHNFSIGREEIYTPLVEHDAYFFIPNSFEVIHYDNKSFQNITIHVGYFHSMSGVWDTGGDGSKFESMSDASYVSSVDKVRAKDSGMYYGGFEYTDEHHNFQLWEYYLDELYNNALIQYEYSNTFNMLKYTIGAQIIDFKEVGELKKHNDTNIDYTIYGAKISAQLNFGLNLALSMNKYSDGEGSDATLGAFGGYPQYATGMMFHFFESDVMAGNTTDRFKDATTSKLSMGYDLSKLGLGNSSFKYVYTTTKNSIDKTIDTNGVKLSYKHNSGASISGAYEKRDVSGLKDYYAMRILGGYKF